MQTRVFCFFTGGSGVFNSYWHVWQWKEEAMLCKIHMHDFKSHFQWDFLAYCTKPVSVRLAMACVSCLFDSFSIFLLKFKTTSHENHVFLYPFSDMAISPQNNEKKKLYFILVNCMGWQVLFIDNACLAGERSFTINKVYCTHGRTSWFRACRPRDVCLHVCTVFVWIIIVSWGQTGGLSHVWTVVVLCGLTGGLSHVWSIVVSCGLTGGLSHVWSMVVSCGLTGGLSHVWIMVVSGGLTGGLSHVWIMVVLCGLTGLSHVWIIVVSCGQTGLSHRTSQSPLAEPALTSLWRCH